MQERIHWEHVGILGRSWLRNAMRSGAGISYLIVFLLVSLGIVQAVVEPIRITAGVADGFGGVEGAGATVAQQAMDALRPVVSWWIDAEGGYDDRVSFLITERPAILSAILILMLAFTPFLVTLAAFNQTAGDIASRGLRYLLVRTERVNIYLARLIGVILFTSLVSLFFIALALMMIGLMVGGYPFLDLLLWGLQGWLALVLVSLPFICFCAWISASMDGAGTALVIAFLIVTFAILLINMFQGAVRGDDLAWLDRITPWGWKYDALHPNFLNVLGGAGALLGFSALFAWLGLRTFRTRDL